MASELGRRCFTSATRVWRKLALGTATLLLDCGADPNSISTRHHRPALTKLREGSLPRSHGGQRLRGSVSGVQHPFRRYRFRSLGSLSTPTCVVGSRVCRESLYPSSSIWRRKRQQTRSLTSFRSWSPRTLRSASFMQLGLPRGATSSCPLREDHCGCERFSTCRGTASRTWV